MKLTAILLLFFVLPVMSLEQFEIEIDNHEAVHYPGQVVSGRVVLVTDSPKVVRGERFLEKPFSPYGVIQQ